MSEALPPDIAARGADEAACNQSPASWRPDSRPMPFDRLGVSTK